MGNLLLSHATCAPTPPSQIENWAFSYSGEFQMRTAMFCPAELIAEGTDHAPVFADEDPMAFNTLVGNENPVFFRRLFKRCTGLTPGAYRRMFQRS